MRRLYSGLLVSHSAVNQHGILHCFRDGPRHINGGGDGDNARSGQRTTARFKAGDTVLGDTAHDGKTGVGTHGGGAEACRHCHGRAGTGAAGVVVGIIGAMHLPATGTEAVGHIVRGIVGKLGHVGFAQNHRAVFSEICNNRRVFHGDIVRQHAAACRSRQTCHIDIVFDQNRQAEQREILFITPFVKLLCLTDGSGIKKGHAVQPTGLVVGFNPPQIVPGQPFCGDNAFCQQFPQLHRGVFVQCFHRFPSSAIFRRVTQSISAFSFCK